ncbi:hypothetical protein PUN28_000034 [Cardiocondyla obscurior]|uniref:Uncharacterized protein n=1 Tax=Cardiocondyla obscurior TaxID=286306 RepID=A0AAW2GXV1_9HYME
MSSKPRRVLARYYLKRIVLSPVIKSPTRPSGFSSCFSNVARTNGSNCAEVHSTEPHREFSLGSTCSERGAGSKLHREEAEIHTQKRKIMKETKNTVNIIVTCFLLAPLLSILLLTLLMSINLPSYKIMRKKNVTTRILLHYCSEFPRLFFFFYFFILLNPVRPLLIYKILHVRKCTRVSF